jgi:glycolate oxidase FAD binding subunit
VFHPLDATLAELHRKLKAVFDPHGVFNRGRMLADI